VSNDGVDLPKLGDFPIGDKHAVRPDANVIRQHKLSVLLRGGKVVRVMQSHVTQDLSSSGGEYRVGHIQDGRPESSPATTYRWAGGEAVTLMMMSVSGASPRTRDQSAFARAGDCARGSAAAVGVCVPTVPDPRTKR
jgi:hypothetical protein